MEEYILQIIILSSIVISFIIISIYMTTRKIKLTKINNINKINNISLKYKDNTKLQKQTFDILQNITNKKNNKKCYITNYNGMRPYKIIIESNNKVKIYENINPDDWSNNNIFHKNPLMTINPEKIFIGRSNLSKMTQLSGTFGDSEYDGNTLLFKMKNNIYIYIDLRIFSFKALADINIFVSPVGGNNIPYPFAIDIDNNTYLLGKDLIIKNYKYPIPCDEYDDPYIFYYNNKEINKEDFIKIEKIEEIK
jgi:hypothetical protein